MSKKNILLISIILILGFTSCVTTEKDPVYTNSSKTLSLVFAGDIMAHTNVTKKGSFDLIWKDVKPFISNSDFAFANLETPVCNSKDYQNYPEFNVKSEYVDECIAAGFNVFSLTNNHSNDLGLEGIVSTREVFKNYEEKYRNTKREVFACGLKDESKGPLTYRVIEKNGWRILFVSVTELLNRGDANTYIDYILPYEKKRNQFKEQIIQLRKDNPCDLFVLSLHSSEVEYETSVKESYRKYYNELLSCDVDVLWINHAHVTKEWELFQDENGNVKKVIFYGMGNTISGQRFSFDLKNSDDKYEKIGDGLMCRLIFEKSKKGINIKLIEPLLITTYITPEKKYVVKKLNDDFIKELSGNEKTKYLVPYFTKRKECMEKIEGKTSWL